MIFPGHCSMFCIGHIFLHGCNHLIHCHWNLFEHLQWKRLIWSWFLQDFIFWLIIYLKYGLFILTGHNFYFIQWLLGGMIVYAAVRNNFATSHISWFVLTLLCLTGTAMEFFTLNFQKCILIILLYSLAEIIGALSPDGMLLISFV